MHRVLTADDAAIDKRGAAEGWSTCWRGSSSSAETAGRPQRPRTCPTRPGGSSRAKWGPGPFRDLTDVVRAAVGRFGRFQGCLDRTARRQQVRHQGVHALPGLHQGPLRILQGRIGRRPAGPGPQRRGTGRVPGRRGQEGPAHPGPVRWRADRRFGRAGQDLDRQEAVGGFCLSPAAEGGGRLPGFAPRDVAQGTGRGHDCRHGRGHGGTGPRWLRRDRRLAMPTVSWSTKATTSATTRRTASWPWTRRSSATAAAAATGHARNSSCSRPRPSTTTCTIWPTR